MIQIPGSWDARWFSPRALFARPRVALESVIGTAEWADKPLKDGNALEPLAEERRRETGLAVQSVSRLMRSGEYQKAKREFPPTYDVARLRISGKIKSSRPETTRDYMEAQGIDDNRPLGALLHAESEPRA